MTGAPLCRSDKLRALDSTGPQVGKFLQAAARFQSLITDCVFTLRLLTRHIAPHRLRGTMNLRGRAVDSATVTGSRPRDVSYLVICGKRDSFSFERCSWMRTTAEVFGFPASACRPSMARFMASMAAWVFPWRCNRSDFVSSTCERLVTY